MQINSIILEKIQSNNNMITTAQVSELGFSRSILTKYVKAGLLERSRQGVYILSDSVHDDMYTLMMRSKKIIFSHDTALFLNGLSERTPFTHSVTIPSNTSLPNSLIDECQSNELERLSVSEYSEKFVVKGGMLLPQKL